MRRRSSVDKASTAINLTASDSERPCHFRHPSHVQPRPHLSCRRMSSAGYIPLPVSVTEALGIPKATPAKFIWLRRLLSVIVLAVFLIGTLSYGLSDNLSQGARDPPINATEVDIASQGKHKGPSEFTDIRAVGDTCPDIYTPTNPQSLPRSLTSRSTASNFSH